MAGKKMAVVVNERDGEIYVNPYSSGDNARQAVADCIFKRLGEVADVKISRAINAAYLDQDHYEMIRLWNDYGRITGDNEKFTIVMKLVDEKLPT